MRTFVWNVLRHNFSQDCRNIKGVCLLAIGDTRHLFRSLGSPNNVFLRKVESKVLRPNFSQDCTNIMEVCLFEIGGLRHLLRSWGVQIMCFS